MTLSTLTSHAEEDKKIREDDPFYSASNLLHLMESIQQLKAGKGTAHDLIEDYDD